MNYASVTILDVLTIILCLYVIFECFDAVTDMGMGYNQFCQKLKYCLGFSTSSALIYYAFRQIETEFQWLIFGMAGTLAVFVWPRVVWRWQTLLDDVRICTDWGEHDG